MQTDIYLKVAFKVTCYIFKKKNSQGYWRTAIRLLNPLFLWINFVKLKAAYNPDSNEEMLFRNMVPFYDGFEYIFLIYGRKVAAKEV